MLEIIKHLQRSLLILVVGTEALHIYLGRNSLDTDSDDDMSRKLDAPLLGKTIEAFERYKVSNSCYCLGDSLLRDRIVL